MKKTLLLLCLFPNLCFGASIGSLTLDSTYESISVRIETTATDYTEADLTLEYQIDGAETWITGHKLTKIHYDNNWFIGSIFKLTKNTTYNVRVSETSTPANYDQGQIATRNDVFPTGTGSDYYVRTDGHDTNCDGSQNEAAGDGTCAFLTITKAESMVSAGDIVHVQPGVYHEMVTVNVSGDASNYIKFVGENGRVYLSGANAALDVSGGSNWTACPTETCGEGNTIYYNEFGSRVYQVGYRDTTENYDKGHRLVDYRQSQTQCGVVNNAQCTDVDAPWDCCTGWQTGTCTPCTFQNFIDEDLATVGVDGGFWSEDDGTLYVWLPDDSDPDSGTTAMLVQPSTVYDGFLITGADYIIIDNFYIGYYGKSGKSNPAVGIDILNSSYYVIQNCDIYNVYYGIYARTSGTTDETHYGTIQDNYIYDAPELFTWPWSVNKSKNTETFAITTMAGGGTVIRRNDIKYSFNGINPGSWGDLDEIAWNFNVDVYDNTAQYIGDDCYEPEGANINNRFWNNVCKDAIGGFSIAPITVGPTYFIGNKASGIKLTETNEGGSIVKMANSATYGAGRVYFYHNSGYVAEGNDQASTIRPSGSHGNVTMRNNAFYGHRYAWGSASMMYIPMDWDYDCIYTDNDAGVPTWATGYWYTVDQDPAWDDDLSKLLPPCASSCWDADIHVLGVGEREDMASFSSYTGQEANGTDENPDFIDPENHDLALDPTSPCIDAGVSVVGINDTATSIHPVNSTPDMGADEYFTVDNWVMISPTETEESPNFGWEYAGSFDPYNRLWLHSGGHDAANLSVQSYALWTYDIDNDDWNIQFPPDGPPGA